MPAKNLKRLPSARLFSGAPSSAALGAWPHCWFLAYCFSYSPKTLSAFLSDHFLRSRFWSVQQSGLSLERFFVFLSHPLKRSLERLFSSYSLCMVQASSNGTF